MQATYIRDNLQFGLVLTVFGTAGHPADVSMVSKRQMENKTGHSDRQNSFYFIAENSCCSEK